MLRPVRMEGIERITVGPTPPLSGLLKACRADETISAQPHDSLTIMLV